MTNSLLVELVVVPGEWPEGLDPRTIGSIAEDMLGQTGRIDVTATRVGDPGPPVGGTPRIELRVEPDANPIFGTAWMVHLDRYDEYGPAEEYSMGFVGTDASGVEHVARDVAACFADPDDYVDLMKSLGHSGHIQHPSVRELDPQSALMDMEAALMNGDEEPIARIARWFRRIAPHENDPGFWLLAAEMQMLADDPEGARAVLDAAADTIDDSNWPLVEIRRAGVAAWEQLGVRLVAIAMRLGQLEAAGGDLQTALEQLEVGGIPGELLRDAPGLRELLLFVFGTRVEHLSQLGAALHRLVEAPAADREPATEGVSQLMWRAVHLLRAAFGADVASTAREAFMGNEAGHDQQAVAIDLLERAAALVG